MSYHEIPRYLYESPHPGPTAPACGEESTRDLSPRAAMQWSNRDRLTVLIRVIGQARGSLERYGAKKRRAANARSISRPAAARTAATGSVPPAAPPAPRR